VAIPDRADRVEVLVDPDEIVDEKTHENNRVLLPLAEVKDLTKPDGGDEEAQTDRDRD
jgi:hypothetical protein